MLIYNNFILGYLLSSLGINNQIPSENINSDEEIQAGIGKLYTTIHNMQVSAYILTNMLHENNLSRFLDSNFKSELSELLKEIYPDQHQYTDNLDNWRISFVRKFIKPLVESGVISRVTGYRMQDNRLYKGTKVNKNHEIDWFELSECGFIVLNPEVAMIGKLANKSETIKTFQQRAWKKESGLQKKVWNKKYLNTINEMFAIARESIAEYEKIKNGYSITDILNDDNLNADEKISMIKNSYHVFFDLTNLIADRTQCGIANGVRFLENYCGNSNERVASIANKIFKNQFNAANLLSKLSTLSSNSYSHEDNNHNSIETISRITGILPGYVHSSLINEIRRFKGIYAQYKAVDWDNSAICAHCSDYYFKIRKTHWKENNETESTRYINNKKIFKNNNIGENDYYDVRYNLNSVPNSVYGMVFDTYTDMMVELIHLSNDKTEKERQELFYKICKFIKKSANELENNFAEYKRNIDGIALKKNILRQIEDLKQLEKLDKDCELEARDNLQKKINNRTYYLKKKLGDKYANAMERAINSDPIKLKSDIQKNINKLKSEAMEMRIQRKHGINTHAWIDSDGSVNFNLEKMIDECIYDKSNGKAWMQFFNEETNYERIVEYITLHIRYAKHAIDPCDLPEDHPDYCPF